MLNLLNYLRRPEYVFRPCQVFRRLGRIGKTPACRERIRLPWGAVVEVDPTENIGNEIYHYGIFDKLVPETIVRLLDRGECALEIGANIGQNCSLMAVKAGPAGYVIAFEPHPEIFAELEKNARGWETLALAKLQLENVALSNEAGMATLVTSEEFSHNRGSAAIQKSETTGGFRVRMRRLDDYLESTPAIGVCKIDVEGHELMVLEGARETLRRRIIRDLIFEDFQPQPSPVTQLLQTHGYAVYQIRSSWLKPRLTPLTASAAGGDFSHNYLATLEEPRAAQRFRTAGWRCLLNL